MNGEQLEKLLPLFEGFQEIKLVYFFGSKANGNDGPLSDYDFAVYLDGTDKNRMFDVKFKLYDELSRALGTDKVDVVVLNLSESPEFKYNVIQHGKLLFEREPYRILVEPRILNDYFDFMCILRRHGLTRA